MKYFLYTTTLSLPLIELAQLSAAGKRIYIYLLVNHLGLSLPRKSAVMLTDRFDITKIDDLDAKQQ